jgi:uncharacterized Zn finger protein
MANPRDRRVPKSQAGQPSAALLAKLQKNYLEPNQAPRVLKVTSKALASKSWARSWNLALARHEIYQGRLSAGRKILRQNGIYEFHVLQDSISGLILADEIYECSIHFAVISEEAMGQLKDTIWGKVATISQLLQGDFPDDLLQAIMDIPGFLPAPGDFSSRCNCLDDADLCAHAASLLYGFSSHLEQNPSDLFQIRGIAISDLLAVVPDSDLDGSQAKLDKSDFASLFDIQVI